MGEKIKDPRSKSKKQAREEMRASDEIRVELSTDRACCERQSLLAGKISSERHCPLQNLLKVWRAL